MSKVWPIIGIIISVLIICFLATILFNGINNRGVFNMGTVFQSLERNQTTKRKEEEFDLAKIENIEFDLKSADIYVKESTDSKLKVIEYTRDSVGESELFVSNVSGTSITITQPNIIKFFYINSFAYEVYIPKEYASNLKIKNSSGEIFIETELSKTNNITIESTSGNIKANRIDGKEIKMSSTSGEVIIGDEIISDSLTLKSTSGDVETKSINSKKVSIKTTSGEIEINGKISSEVATLESTSGNIQTGDIVSTNSTVSTKSGYIEIGELEGQVNAESISGNIFVNKLKIISESFLKSTSGDVKAFIDSTSNCEIKTKSTSGNISLPNNSSIVGNSPFVSLNIKTTSGSIKVEVK